MLPQTRLGMYRGDSCLETFLAKFENMSVYMRWTEEDRLFHLQASLDGAAGQILWDAGPQPSTQSVIRLLRTRFGNEHQAERFRAELRARRRKKGENLQVLYNDICRLLALAYPGPANATSTIVGRDAFIDALGNQTLRVRILEREPRTIEEAMNVACRLEAFDRSVFEDDFDDDQPKVRGRQLRQVKDRVEGSRVAADDVVQLKQQIDNKRVRLEECVASNRKLKSENELYAGREAMSSGAIVGQPSSSMLPPMNPYVEQPPRRPPVDRSTRPCFGCGGYGHWKRECPNRPSFGAPMNPPTFGNVAQWNSVSTSVRPAEIYVDARIEGKPVICLLDTGCARTVIGRKLIPNHVLSSTDLNLFAANGTSIPLIGVLLLNLIHRRSKLFEHGRVLAT
jgi:hypothetical protein